VHSVPRAQSFFASPHLSETQVSHPSTLGVAEGEAASTVTPASPPSRSPASLTTPASPSSHDPAVVFRPPFAHEDAQSVAHFPHVRASLHDANAAYAGRGSAPPSSVGAAASALAQKHCVRAPADSPNGLSQARSATHRGSVRQTAQGPAHSSSTHDVHAVEPASASPPSNAPASSRGASFVRTVHPPTPAAAIQRAAPLAQQSARIGPEMKRNMHMRRKTVPQNDRTCCGEG
jgi:hypothetical protein